jgi:hypothetical protein
VTTGAGFATHKALPSQFMPRSKLSEGDGVVCRQLGKHQASREKYSIKEASRS